MSYISMHSSVDPMGCLDYVMIEHAIDPTINTDKWNGMDDWRLNLETSGRDQIDIIPLRGDGLLRNQNKSPSLFGLRGHCFKSANIVMNMFSRLLSSTICLHQYYYETLPH